MSHNTVSDINTDTHFHVKNELLHILDIPSYEPAIYAWGVMRHGKTAQKDNESGSSHILATDPPKGTAVSLSGEERNAQTSTIYMTLKQIATLGYKKIRIYAPHDTKRNDETLTLMYTYAQELGITLVEDTEFSGVDYFAARKKIDQRIVQELVDKGYMSAREYQQLHLWQSGEKAIFGNAKRLTDVLSATALQKIAEEDTELYTKVCEQIEEVYGDTINNAGQGFDALAQYIEEKDQRDEFHLVLGYRTTLQAFDKKFIEIDPKNIDLHYTSKPSEMHLGCLDKNGGVSKQMKELWTPVAETYTADIASFQTFVPGVAATHTIVANQNAINAYLLQVKLELQEDIASKKDMSFWVQKAQDNGFVQKIIYKELIEHMLGSYDKQSHVACAQALVNMIRQSQDDAMNMAILESIKNTDHWLKYYIVDKTLAEAQKTPKLLIYLGAMLGNEALTLYDNGKKQGAIGGKKSFEDSYTARDEGQKVYTLGAHHRIVIVTDDTFSDAYASDELEHNYYSTFDSNCLDIDKYLSAMEDGMKNIEESYPPQKLYEKRMKQLMEYVLSPLCDTLFTDTTYKSRDAIREKGLLHKKFFVEYLGYYLAEDVDVKEKYKKYREKHSDILPLG